MRIRQIKPAWWLDKALRFGLSADAREFYIGLWMLADDDGYLEWDVERIAAELYPYGVGSTGLLTMDVIVGREQAVKTWATQLAALDKGAPHLIFMDCGHARVPKIVEHQRFGGRPVRGIHDAHERRCARMRADARPGRVGNGRGKVGNGTREDGPADGGPSSEFTERMAALGAVKP